MAGQKGQSAGLGLQHREARAKLFQRQGAYTQTFENRNPINQEVLEDLAKFCRAGSTTFHPDPRVHAALEGRREVYLRILDHLELSSEELWAKYNEKNQGAIT